MESEDKTVSIVFSTGWPRHSRSPLHRATFDYMIGDEVFVADDSEGDSFIRHQSWSLIGSGRTLLEAEADLLDEGQSLKKALAGMKYETLDDEARRLLLFLDTVA
ncbi:MAG: hypothetical protein ACC655_01535 [Rhodothermia bacterium]